MARHALVAVLWLCPALAVAQSASDTKAAANSLFDEAKRVLAAGDLDHACPKFAASLQLVEQLGVRLNLADCYERQGHTASAWAEFREAASQADKRGDARAAYAKQRADALAPRLVKLQISVPAPSRVPGLAVRRDGAAVPSDAFDSPLPVNPGSITIEAAAPGYQPWSSHVDATRVGEIVTVEVPPLVAVPAKIEPPVAPRVAAQPIVREPDAPVERTARSRRHLIGIGVGAAGVAALGVGVGLGLEARSKWGSVGTHCNAAHVCDARGASINRDARSLGNTGTIVGGVGLAALVAGTVIYVTAPAARSIVEHAYLDVGRGSSAQLGFAGQF